MKKQLYIPACRKFLEDENGVMDVQRLFSLSRQAYNLKYPGEFPDSKELLSFLQANGLVPPSYRVEELNTEHVELCFSIITKHNCNSLCQLCGYSPLYKNQLEEQESVLLGYALSSWNNLQALIQSGITSRHFRAMISVSEKSKVAVVPLNRLAFEYMEKIPKSQNDMRTLPEQIITAIKTNNKNKLSASDVKVVQRYLENLQNSKYQFLDAKIIQNILAECYRLDYKEYVEEKEEPTSAPVYIDGFLGGNIPEKPSVRNSPQEQTDKKQDLQEPIAETSSISEEQQIVPIMEEREENIIDTKDEKPIEAPPKTSPKKAHKIIEWSLSKAELHNCIVIDLEQASKSQFQRFLDNLLMTPILPLEIGTLEKQSVVFIYMAEKLYYFSTSNSVIMDDMLPYISQSKFRKIVCFEPYRIYSYLYEQQITSVNLFSLKICTDYIEELKKNNKKPTALIKKLLNKDNKTSLHELCFAMSNYQKLYEILGTKHEVTDAYHKKMLLCQLLGFSYVRNHISNSSLPLFLEETTDGYVFTYRKEEQLMEPFTPVQIKISWNDTSDFPVEELLIQLAAINFYYKHQVVLLSYSRNTAAFAIDKNKIVYVCEIINNATCAIAEGKKKTPINVAVTKLIQ